MPQDELRERCMTLDWSPTISFLPWTLVTKQNLCSGAALLDQLQSSPREKCSRIWTST
jgi:NTE family protein